MATWFSSARSRARRGPKHPQHQEAPEIHGCKRDRRQRARLTRGRDFLRNIEQRDAARQKGPFLPAEPADTIPSSRRAEPSDERAVRERQMYTHPSGEARIAPISATSIERSGSRALRSREPATPIVPRAIRTPPMSASGVYQRFGVDDRATAPPPSGYAADEAMPESVDRQLPPPA